MRLYSLFEKRPEGWTRISNYSYKLASARKVYQNQLLAPYLDQSKQYYKRELRPVK